MCAARRLSEAERKKEIMDSAAKVIMDKGFEKATMVLSGKLNDVLSGSLFYTAFGFW